MIGQFFRSVLELLHSLHIAHAGDLAHAAHDSLQVLEVGDVGDDFHRGMVFGGLGFDVADVGVGVADDGGDLLSTCRDGCRRAR